MSGIVLLSLAFAQVAASGCYVLTQPAAAGDVIDTANAMPAPCTGSVDVRKLRYDRRARVVRAQVALAAGEPLGRAFLPLRPPVLAGDRVAIAVRVGPVTVSREAVALQRAGAGRRFFVRGSDGAVFTAPAVAEEQVR